MSYFNMRSIADSLVYSTQLKPTRNSAVADKPRDAFRGQSRSPNMVPFHMLGMVFYYYAIVTLSVRKTFEIFDFKNAVTLKTGSGAASLSWRPPDTVQRRAP